MNSTYDAAEGLHATVHVHDPQWKELFSADTRLDSGADSAQRVLTIPDGIYSGAERTFIVDLTLADAAGRTVSRNFYWVPGTLTTFNWNQTDYTHTPAERHEDLTALRSLPAAQVTAHAEIETTSRGRELRVHLSNGSQALAFQVHAAARTASGGLIAPVFWSDNWIELAPGESTTLTALLPADSPASLIVPIEGWNVAATTLTPTTAEAKGSQ